MADKRINALTTTSASVGDDYFAIDGATNGTRALSAFSPTFGGNATVGGTLTVSGATMSVGGGSGSIVSALDGTAGNYKLHLFRSGGVDRWYCGLQAATETGSNAGAPFGITALSDAGAQIDVPLQITRAAGGAVTIVRPTAITNTTASTSTSSGALVVGNGTQGGLGVGGAIYAGDTIETTSGSNRIVLGATNYIWHYRSGADGQLRLTRGGVHDWDFKGGTNLTIAADTTTVLTITSGGNTTVTGSVTTGAPTGGTAAAWKLGAVATVSPTSPNRTIEVDIGGTIYYIHAKTTNN